MPLKSAKLPHNRGRELEPKRRDSQALLAWKQRMASAEEEEIYKQRAATSETVKRNLRRYRGLIQLTVSRLEKCQVRGLWCALALPPASTVSMPRRSGRPAQGAHHTATTRAHAIYRGSVYPQH